MTTRTALTIDDIEAAYGHESHDDCPGWLGFGYLGARRNALDTSDPEAIVSPDAIAACDALALETANGLGWTSERFFEWLNSKLGRWFAESRLHSDDAVERSVALVR